MSTSKRTLDLFLIRLDVAHGARRRGEEGSEVCGDDWSTYVCAGRASPGRGRMLNKRQLFFVSIDLVLRVG